jgi:hypothetical protein
VKCTSVALLIPCLVLACEQRSGQAETAGEMTVQWDGSRDGSVTAPATASWCEGRRLLEIRSIRGDTGIALALYPGRRITAGTYRIVEPTRAESIPPAAAVAVRWLTRNVVQGFQGDSGQLQLERSRFGQLSGQVHARARSVVDTQRITLTASFRDLPPRPDSLGCAPINRTDEDLAPDDAAEAGDTMVD